MQECPRSLNPLDVRQLHKTIGNNAVAQRLAPVSSSPSLAKENRTGLPDTLKTGIESLSGLSLDDVRVHYNSSDPAQLQAAAYTQGSKIYVGPGYEKHLPHEAWHVVQQMQGRVNANTEVGGEAVNDDPMLEKEADRMGVIAVQRRAEEGHAQDGGCPDCASQPLQMKSVIQMVKLNKADVARWELLLNEAMEAAEDVGNNVLYNKLDTLYHMVDTDADSATIQFEYNQIMGVSVHPSGYADGTGALYPKYYDVRSSFFPSGYNLAASQHRDNIVTAATDKTNANLWLCPQCNKPRDKTTYAGEPTIDHRTDCATYWNKYGYDNSRQDRINFYNDTTNHDIMCRSCNSSKNSGGVTYNRFIGPNFTN
jgi:hypothetical protein